MHISRLKEGYTVIATMENRADEATAQLSRFYTSRKPYYTLFFFIILFFSSLSLPFRFQSFGLNFTSFLDANDRHYIFLLCNVILFLLYLDSSFNQAAPEAKKIECSETSVISVDDGCNYLNSRDQTEDVETEVVVDVHNENELAKEVRQIEQNGMLVGVDDRIEDSKTELVLDFEDKNESIAKFEVEEHEHADQEEANEFHQKCEAFIRKVRQSMHHEGPPPRI